MEPERDLRVHLFFCFMTLIVLSIAILLLSSCTVSHSSSYSQDSIAIDPARLEIPADGGKTDIHILATDEFAIYTDTKWISNIEPPYVFGTEGTVTVKVDKNSDYSERTGEITIKCNDTYASVPVAQAGREKIDVDPDIRVPDGYTLVWHDEFDYEGLPNTSEWKYQTGSSGWGNNELQDYVAGTYKGENIADVRDGILKIYAKKIDGKVRSCRLNTRKSWAYGWIEASLRLPAGRGTWPAFWMMPSNYSSWPEDGELDIMEEVGYNASYCSSTIHCTRYNNGGTSIEHAERYISTAQSEFHVYAMEWSEDAITFYQDYNAILTYKNNRKGYDYWPFDNPFYVILNLAWGGSWGGAQGVDESCLPCALEVDYVRVFQK